MKIGDQLELVAKLRREKGQEKRQEEVKSLLTDFGTKLLPLQQPESRCPVDKHLRHRRAFI